jgi:hypothetical protein
MSDFKFSHKKVAEFVGYAVLAFGAAMLPGFLFTSCKQATLQERLEASTNIIEKGGRLAWAAATAEYNVTGDEQRLRDVASALQDASEAWGLVIGFAAKPEGTPPDMRVVLDRVEALRTLVPQKHGFTVSIVTVAVAETKLSDLVAKRSEPVVIPYKVKDYRSWAAKEIERRKSK